MYVGHILIGAMTMIFLVPYLVPPVTTLYSFCTLNSELTILFSLGALAASPSHVQISFTWCSHWYPKTVKLWRPYQRPNAQIFVHSLYPYAHFRYPHKVPLSAILCSLEGSSIPNSCAFTGTLLSKFTNTIYIKNYGTFTGAPVPIFTVPRVCCTIKT